MKKLFLLVIVFLLIPIIKVSATTIIDGDLIKTSISNDVYIVKQVPSNSSGQVAEKYKRLILNPEIFNQYGHLKWENIKIVSQAELDEYTTSDLVRAQGDDKVYRVYPNGDIGEKRWIKTADDFNGFGYKTNAIYEINSFERDFYTLGTDLTFQAPPAPPTPPISRTIPIIINVPTDYTTIQKAIDNSIDGDTIAIRNGVYNENINLNKSIKLIGETNYAVIIDGQGIDNTINVSNGKNVFIQRINLRSKDKYGIYCKATDSTSITMKNNTIQSSAWGIVLEDNCKAILTNNLIYNNKNTNNTDGAGILIKNNFAYGIESEIINNTIDGNYHGIWSENSNLKVMNNIVSNNVGGTNNVGIYHVGTGVSENTFNDTWQNGINYSGDAKIGNGSIIVLPSYLEAPMRNYQLKTGATDYSLCFDAGYPDFLYNDAVYTTKTARNDMGAYGGPDNLGWNQ